jgi:hypothetical protein
MPGWRAAKQAFVDAQATISQMGKHVGQMGMYVGQMGKHAAYRQNLAHPPAVAQSLPTKLWNILSSFKQQAANAETRKMVAYILTGVGMATVSTLFLAAVISYFRDLSRQKADIKASTKTMDAIHKAQGQKNISATERQALAVLEATANRVAIPEGIQLTKEDLVQACREQGLPVSGTVDALSERIVDSVESDMIHGTLSNKPMLATLTVSKRPPVKKSKTPVRKIGGAAAKAPARKSTAPARKKAPARKVRVTTTRARPLAYA